MPGARHGPRGLPPAAGARRVTRRRHKVSSLRGFLRIERGVFFPSTRELEVNVFTRVRRDANVRLCKIYVRCVNNTF